MVSPSTKYNCRQFKLMYLSLSLFCLLVAFCLLVNITQVSTDEVYLLNNLKMEDLNDTMLTKSNYQDIEIGNLDKALTKKKRP